jgi:hypothetical protein
MTCPANTNSTAKASLQTQCRCNAGFRCSQTRDVTVTIKFSLTLAEFQTKKAAILSKVATYAGVTDSAVAISSSPAAARRLLEMDERHTPTIIVAHTPLHFGEDLAITI